jgi:PAS domain S-box-containing protein
MNAQVVLVIEDNPTTRKIVRLTLGNEGFSLIEASNGAEGLALASTTPPDLILQDLLLPDMEGFELVRRLRALPDLASVPIIAFSGFLSRLEHGRAAGVGFTDFLPKPVEPSRLVQVVRAHLASQPVPIEVTGRSHRVLVVDDDPVQLKLARIRLTGLGFDVATAIDGVEALELLQRDDTEVVVSDVLMPRLDGFGLCAAMQKDPRFSRVPLILVSSNYVEDADRRLAHRMGATAFVVRTPELAGVIEALNAAVSLPGDARIAAVHSGPAEHQQHHERVLRQLERQAALNVAFAHQSAMHASMLSVVAGISESLTKRHSLERSAPDILASLLDASGVSMGALFVKDARAGEAGAAAIDRLVLRAQLGWSARAAEDVRTFFGHRALFERAVAAKAPLVVSSAIESSPEHHLLGRAGMKSALIVPCVADDECLAVVLLASKARDLTETDWIPFARMISVQMGQAFSLSRAFSRLEHEVLERTKAESEVRHERDRAQRYLDTAEVILLKLDLEGRIALVNRYGCSILGWTAEELLGRDWFETCLPARTRNESRTKFFELIRGDRSISDSLVVTKSGEERLIDWRNRLLRDDEGRVVGVFSSGADITERNRAVEALRTAEERTRFALKNADVGIWDLDYTTGVLRWSEILEAHYGVQPGTFGGTFEAFVERIHPDDRAAVLETVEKAMTSGADFSVLNRSIQPDGAVRWLSGAGRFSLGEHGEPVRAVGISQDVTERLQAEEVLEHSRQAQLRLKDEFLSHVSHELRTPVTAILQFTRILLDGLAGELTTEQCEYQQIVLRNGEQLVSMIDELIEVTRLATGPSPMEPEGVSVTDAVTDILETHQGTARSKAVTLSCDLSPNLPFAYADRDSLRRILTILVEHALNATVGGEGVTVRASTLDRNPGFLRLEVSDGGSGGGRNGDESVFEPFHPESTAEQSSRAGLGLGLFVCKELIRRQGGRIWVEPQAKGRTLSFTLPAIPTRVA